MKRARVEGSGVARGPDRNHGGADMAQVRSWAGLDVHRASVLAATMDRQTSEMRVRRLPARDRGQDPRPRTLRVSGVLDRLADLGRSCAQVRDHPVRQRERQRNDVVIDELGVVRRRR